jgi:hypothetical protein
MAICANAATLHDLRYFSAPLIDFPLGEIQWRKTS